MIEGIASLYRPIFARAVVYMLQASEYNVSSYLRWFWRTSDFSRAMYRKSLVMTRPAKLLLTAMRAGMLLQIIVAAILGWWGWRTNRPAVPLLGLALFLSTPIVWAHLIVLPLLIGRWLIIVPISKRRVSQSGKIFARHPAIKIAITGSYGKTTMKEILQSVLSEGKKVAATSGNMNVPISHAGYARKLEGNEDILLIEYGEGAPGDVARFSRTTKPTIGIITGLAPAHLDKYKTLEAAGRDIFSITKVLPPENVYVNAQSEVLRAFIKDGYNLYDPKGVLGWKISNVKVTLDGISFTMKEDGKSLKIKSKLLGRHQIGPLALAAALAAKLGLSIAQIEAGIAKIEPFEHRMQPYQLGGATIIDDTYNGNIEGMLAGLELLKELPANRKIYVTPGLVGQGRESKDIHQKLGEAIAKAKPSQVVLMKHSVTDHIKEGLNRGKYQGELKIEEDPLNFYTNLDQVVAAGDLVLMQNDWSDNYN